MASTGTYAYNPYASNLTLVAYGRIGIRRSEIQTQHMTDAEQEANLLQVEMGNKQPLYWRSELYTQELTSGTATYTLPARMIAMQAAFLSTEIDDATTDRVIWPLSAYEYAAVPNKTLEAVPTSYWYNRQITPTVTMWPVPDDAATYTLNLRILSQVQDASLSSGATLDMPYRFLDVFVAGLAHRLSRIYAPDKEQMRKMDYMEAWKNAAQRDVEDQVSLNVMPAFSGYFRR